MVVLIMLSLMKVWNTMMNMAHIVSYLMITLAVGRSPEALSLARPPAPGPRAPHTPTPARVPEASEAAATIAPVATRLLPIPAHTAHLPGAAVLPGALLTAAAAPIAAAVRAAHPRPTAAEAARAAAEVPSPAAARVAAARPAAEAEDGKNGEFLNGQFTIGN